MSTAALFDSVWLQEQLGTALFETAEKLFYTAEPSPTCLKSVGTPRLNMVHKIGFILEL